MISSQIDVSSDILSLVFEQLVGDCAALSSASLVSRAWHAHAAPFLLRDVDLSSHNRGRMPDFEDEHYFPCVYADFSDRFPPRESQTRRHDWLPKNLVHRQRAFLRLITDRPDLARCTHSFTWTLVWMADGDTLQDIDLQTWNVFQAMINVTRLDLASIHEIWDQPFIRQNPAKMFPAVIDLRLVGWMHRGLVHAILSSIDCQRLSSLKLDYAQDEGALPDGMPMPEDLNLQYAHSCAQSSHNYTSLEDSDVIAEDLYHRQETGAAAIFPGPMWLPLKLLSRRQPDRLKEIQIRLTPFSTDIDVRNYHTVFNEAAKLIASMQKTLQSLTVILGEPPVLYDPSITEWGNGRGQLDTVFRPQCISFAAIMLKSFLSVLTKQSFPQLINVTFEGFHVLEQADDWDRRNEHVLDALILSRSTSYGISCTRKCNIDHRPVFAGYDCSSPSSVIDDDLKNILLELN